MSGSVAQPNGLMAAEELLLQLLKADFVLPPTNVGNGPEADISRQTKTDMHNVRFLLLLQWQPAPLKDCEHCSILRKHIGL